MMTLPTLHDLDAVDDGTCGHYAQERQRTKKTSDHGG
jgi:hypothetical protein